MEFLHSKTNQAAEKNNKLSYMQIDKKETTKKGLEIGYLCFFYFLSQQIRSVNI